MSGRTSLCARLPLYDGKLDLLAFGRCFELDPGRLSVRFQIREDDGYDDFVQFHPISIDFKTGLSRSTWDEIAEEVLFVTAGFLCSHGKTQEDALVLSGPDYLPGSEPSWLSNFSPCRGIVDVESVICHRFIVVFRNSLKLGRHSHVEPTMPRLVDIFWNEPYPQEEDTYIDRHVLSTVVPEKILPPIPDSYCWLQQEKIAEQEMVFPVKAINLNVKVRSKSKAVLAYGLGIDLVSHMTQAGLNRCEVEFYMWTSKSSLPYVQVFTDLKTGAVAFRLKRSMIVFETMSVDRLQDFLQRLSSALPLDPASCSAWSDPERVSRCLLKSFLT